MTTTKESEAASEDALESDETEPGPQPEPTAEEVRADLLSRNLRGYTPVRRILVQLYDEDPDTGERGSTVAALLRERKHRSLTLYLFLLSVWDGLEGLPTPHGSFVWLRALTSSHTGALSWSESTLSRTWSDLEERGLVTRERKGRLVRISPRREDGAQPYTKPTGNGNDDLYFVLPHAFWSDEWFARLKMPALAVFLILAKETNSTKRIHRTTQQLEDWYGISRKSAQAGLNQLRAEGLLHVEYETVKAPLSKLGWTKHAYYSLKHDFGHDAREAARARAKKVVDARSKKPRAAKATKTPSS